MTIFISSILSCGGCSGCVPSRYLFLLFHLLHPIRNPKVFPTGRNMHSLDSSAIPTQVAVEVPEDVVRNVLEKLKDDNDDEFPESIVFALWGTNIIKT